MPARRSHAEGSQKRKRLSSYRRHLGKDLAWSDLAKSIRAQIAARKVQVRDRDEQLVALRKQLEAVVAPDLAESITKLSTIFENDCSVENFALLVARVREDKHLVNALARFARQIHDSRQCWFRQLSSEATKQRLAVMLETRFNI